MNYKYEIQNSYKGNIAPETGKAYSGNGVQEHLTLKQKIEGLIAKVTDKYDALMQRFSAIRTICCYMALRSTLPLLQSRTAETNG